MEYIQGSIGRIFVARLHEGESIYESIESLASKEGIQAATVLAIGGVRSGKVVTGPENTTGPIVPHYEEFNDARELLGIGTLFIQDGAPSLHFHSGIGRADSAIVGCPRAGLSVFLTLEITIIEINGISAERILDPEMGVHLLKILGGYTIA